MPSGDARKMSGEVGVVVYFMQKSKILGGIFQGYINVEMVNLYTQDDEEFLIEYKHKLLAERRDLGFKDIPDRIRIYIQ